MPTESMFQASTGCDQSSGKIDKLLNDSLNPTMLGFMVDNTIALTSAI